jgi:hypothetical protein
MSESTIRNQKTDEIISVKYILTNKDVSDFVDQPIRVNDAKQVVIIDRIKKSLEVKVYDPDGRIIRKLWAECDSQALEELFTSLMHVKWEDFTPMQPIYSYDCIRWDIELKNSVKKTFKTYGFIRQYPKGMDEAIDLIGRFVFNAAMWTSDLFIDPAGDEFLGRL